MKMAEGIVDSTARVTTLATIHDGRDVHDVTIFLVVFVVVVAIVPEARQPSVVVGVWELTDPLRGLDQTAL